MRKIRLPEVRTRLQRFCKIRAFLGKRKNLKTLLDLATEVLPKSKLASHRLIDKVMKRLQVRSTEMSGRQFKHEVELEDGATFTAKRKWVIVALLLYALVGRTLPEELEKSGAVLNLILPRAVEVLRSRLEGGGAASSTPPKLCFSEDGAVTLSVEVPDGRYVVVMSEHSFHLYRELQSTRTPVTQNSMPSLTEDGKVLLLSRADGKEPCRVRLGDCTRPIVALVWAGKTVVCEEVTKWRDTQRNLGGGYTLQESTLEGGVLNVVLQQQL